MRHFILTRFNLLLWIKDKEGSKVRSRAWLEHRFVLFEKFCLPSVSHQTCKDFTWIVLFDSSTPERFKIKIAGYQKECPQFVPVFVEPENGWRFADTFKEEVRRKMNNGSGERVLTTYLDNDDALNVRFVEDLQKRASKMSERTFIYYSDGYQFYTDHKYLMMIHYLRNHFVSVVESSEPDAVKTIYGYGSHCYIDKIKDVKIEYVKNMPMWCEVVHEKNMGNDAYFLRARMVKEECMLINNFGCNEKVHFGIGLYFFRFLPRYVRTFVRRVFIKLRGYRFE